MGERETVLDQSLVVVDLEPTDLLNQALMDWIIFKNDHKVWTNQHELWKKFIRSY